MTISSLLAAGVAGLNANAARLATISDNIANSATYGYKRSTIDFASLVVTGGGGTYSAGGVRTSSVRLIDERGPIVSTANPTDLSVSRRGAARREVTHGTPAGLVQEQRHRTIDQTRRSGTDGRPGPECGSVRHTLGRRAAGRCAVRHSGREHFDPCVAD